MLHSVFPRVAGFETGEAVAGGKAQGPADFPSESAGDRTRIIDEHGLQGLSIRRLAEALGVNGASLYHHFRNKDEILAGVAELALAEVRMRQPRDAGGGLVDASDERYAALTRALAGRGLSPDEIFDVVAASIIQGIGEAVKQRQARRSSA